MSIFYDPKTKRARDWVVVVLVSVPIILVLFVYIVTKHKMKHNPKAMQQEEVDIFDKF